MNKKYIKIFRFSKDGFSDFKQDYLIEQHQEMLKDFKLNCHLYPKHLQKFIEQSHNEYMKDFETFSYGIFAFLNRLPTKETFEHLTNHLKYKEQLDYNWWSAEIDSSMLAFDGANIWKTDSLKNIGFLSENEYSEVYIPSQYLILRNKEKLLNISLTSERFKPKIR